MKPSESKKAQAKIWGLTGGVASGKSTVARIFSELGVPVVDADQIARELRAPGGAAHDQLLARFGTADAARLREIVFADAGARAAIEAIMHPLIRAESARRIARAVENHEIKGNADTVPVIYEAALLVETGRYRDFAGLIVVSADEQVRLSRLMARDQSPEELARKMVRAQISDEKRRAAATFVIKNHGSLEDLRAQILAILPQLKS